MPKALMLHTIARVVVTCLPPSRTYINIRKPASAAGLVGYERHRSCDADARAFVKCV
jgi:hypothetical protein